MLIYKAVFPNNKCYIGLTTKTLEQRKRSHKSQAKNGSKKLFHVAIRKYGWENINWLILFETNDFELLKLKEIEYIKIYNSIKNGYNLTMGGEGTLGLIPKNKGKPMSETVKQKLSKAHSSPCISFNLKTKEKKHFNSLRQLAKFYNLNYGSVKIALKRKQPIFDIFVTKDLNYNFSNFIQNNKPSHNAYSITLTNGKEIKKFESLEMARKFLNVSERKIRNLFYKNKPIGEWKKQNV